VASTAPVAIPEDQLHLPDGSYIPDVVNWMGYAFATTSYYTNGLAIRAGLTDLANLVSIFKAAHPTVNRIYLVGASEGGLITTLAIEQSPSLYSGGLATCGPVGDFRKQIDYMGDFRIVFDYFFPNVLPGAAITVPQSLMDNWETQYLSQTIAVISDPANAISVTQLLSVTHAAVDPLDSTTAISTVTGVLWYNVFATNDAKARLGGQPFDNYTRTYTGSLNDVALNAGVQRYRADQTALDEIEAYYQTAGRPLVPLVTLHTTLDPIVPDWHETLYRDKVVANGLTPRYDDQEAARYGHCNFTASEVQTALTTLVNLVTNPLRFKVFLPLVLKQ
jgi:dienelactone hydrolase